MVNGICHEYGGGCPDEIDHMRCCRSRVEKNEIVRLNEGGRIFCDFPFGVAVQLIFLRNGVLVCRHLLTGFHGTAEYLFQFALLVERCDIAAHRRLRCIEKLLDLCHGDASLFF